MSTMKATAVPDGGTVKVEGRDVAPKNIETAFPFDKIHGNSTIERASLAVMMTCQQRDGASWRHFTYRAYQPNMMGVGGIVTELKELLNNGWVVALDTQGSIFAVTDEFVRYWYNKKPVA